VISSGGVGERSGGSLPKEGKDLHQATASCVAEQADLSELDPMHVGQSVELGDD
jgi:hypothetical protein